MYLITTCASCAAPLEQTGTGVRVKQCSRCKTRYCSASCQRDHWKKRGGHKTTCEKIAADGGAEKSYAMEEGAEAIMVCFGSPAGAKCYICDRTVVSEVSEDLARGCSCRGKEGFAQRTGCSTRSHANSVLGRGGAVSTIIFNKASAARSFVRFRSTSGVVLCGSQKTG